MADRSYRRENRERSQDYYRPQQEQFDDQSRAWRDEGRGLGQLGESYDRDDYGQFDLGGQSYSRDRDYARDRSRSDLRGGRTATGYSSGPYGAERYDRGDAANFRSFTGSDYGGADFAARRPTYGPGYTGTGNYAASYGGSGYGRANRREYDTWDDRNERGWFERAGDEVASWFGDEEAARRRRQDHRGRGPSGYVRSDERVQEDVNDALTEDWFVDASDIQVSVANGDVTLDGTVSSRDEKRRAENVIEDLSGVKNVQNNLRVSQSTTWDRNNSGETSA